MIALIVVCTRGRITFGEALKVSRLKRSTLWDCVSKLNGLGMIRVEKAITVLGPRTMLNCEEEGVRTLRELEEALKGNISEGPSGLTG